MPTGRGQRGFGSEGIVNATSTPGSIAKGEKMVRTLLLKYDQPVQKALGGIAASVAAPGTLHLRDNKSLPEASTYIAMKGYILPASMLTDLLRGREADGKSVSPPIWLITWVKETLAWPPTCNSNKSSTSNKANS